MRHIWRNARKYVIVVCTVSILMILGKQAEAKQITVHNITESTTFCKLLEDGDTVVLRSNGGSVKAAWEMVDCIRSKYVSIRVERAYSAATFLALAGREVCLKSYARLGFHSAYAINLLTGNTVNLSVKKLRSLSRIVYYRMLDQGYSKQTTLYVIGLTFMTPSENISVLRFDEIKEILDHRFTGKCNEQN